MILPEEVLTGVYGEECAGWKRENDYSMHLSLVDSEIPQGRK